MPNRNQNPGQDQAQQKGRRNPATTMPDDDEAQEGDQTQRAGEQGGQQPGQQAGQQGRRGGRQEPDEPLSEIQQEEDEAGEDEEDDEGMNRPS